MLTDMFSSGSLRSRSRRLGCLALFFLPFLGGALVLSGCLASNAVRARDLLAHQPRAGVQGPDGPVLLEGELEGEREVGEEPGARPAVHAYRVSRHGHKTREVVCAYVAPRSVFLRAGGERVALDDLLFVGVDGWRSGARGASREVLSRLETRFRAGSFDVKQEISPDIRRQCSSNTPTDPAERRPTDFLRDRNLSLAELAVPEGTRVRVLACKQGERLVPCDDGLDAVLSHEMSAMAFAMSKIDVDVVRFIALWNSICLSFFGWFFLGLLPRAPGQKEPFRVDTREGA